MAVVVAGVIELARRALPRFLQQRGFLELRAQGPRRPRHRLDVRKTDLALGDGLHTFGDSLPVPADRDQVSGGGARQMALESEPVIRRRITLQVVEVGGRETSRQVGSVEHLEINISELLLELIGERSALIDLHVLRREHRNRLPNECSSVNSSGRKFRLQTPAKQPQTARPKPLPNLTPPPSSESSPSHSQTLPPTPSSQSFRPGTLNHPLARPPLPRRRWPHGDGQHA